MSDMNELPNRYHAESIDTFLEVLQARRSIRTGFLKDKPVPDELIEKILEAARWAPSAGNSQPWEFIVIRDLEIREKIVEIFKTQMRDKIEIEEAARGQRRRVNAGVDFRHAPVHVLVLGDPRTNDAYPMRTKLDKWEAHYLQQLGELRLAAASGGRGVGAEFHVHQRCSLALFQCHAQVPTRHSGAVADLSFASHRVCEAKSYDSPPTPGTRRNGSP